METIRQIIEDYGGLESLRRSPLRFNIAPGNSLLIEDRGRGPDGRQAIRLTCFLRPNGKLCHSRVLLEVTDLGLLPFFLRSYTGEVMRVYRMDRRRRIRQVRPHVRARIVRKTSEWDDWLGNYLDEREILTT